MKILQYQGIESSISLESEKKAVLDFLERYWNVRVTGDWKLPKVVDYLFDKGIKYGIALRESRVEHEVQFHNKGVELDARLVEEGIEPHTNRTKIDFCRTSKRKSFRFEREMGALERRLVKHAQINAKPKGYEKFCAAHPEEYPDEKDDEKLEFGGTKLHHSIGAATFNFEVYLSRPYVKYDDKSQGRSPTTTMISAIFRQGVNLGVLVVEQRYREQLESAC